MKNGSALKAERYFGLHMSEGVAEYQDTPDATPYRIFLGEEVLKKMDPTYEGKPLYLKHVENVGEREAAGYVVRSFYNEADGKHWAEFLCISEGAGAAIGRGYRLSNSYLPKRTIGGGLWHGVEYVREVIDGEYDHLAIVDDPRYQESIILTPEQFKIYNEEKCLELAALRNSQGSKGDDTMKFDFFKTKKEPVQNSQELSEMSTVLPKSGRTIIVGKFLNDADEAFKKQDDDAKAHKLNEGESMADPHHIVVTHDDRKMSVNDLLEEHKKMADDARTHNDTYNDLKAKYDALVKEFGLEEGREHVDVTPGSKENEDPEMAKKEKEMEAAESEEKAAAEKKKNAQKALEELAAKKGVKVSNALAEKIKAEKEREAQARAAAEALKGAPESMFKKMQNEMATAPVIAETTEDKLARGRKKYGSDK